MMKIRLISFLLFASIYGFGQNDYILQVNDTTLEISLDKRYRLTLDNGEKVSIILTAKDTLLYEDEMFSFSYLKDYKVSKMEIDVDIDQSMIMTAEGSGILIQQYKSINPTMLNEIMLNEVTKESINYGYEMKREDYSRTLKSGQEIGINKAVLTYKGDVNIYEVASIGSKDEGILIMTMKMDDNMESSGQKIIELMWESLVFE